MFENKAKNFEENELARQCRFALEKSWGTTIPVPKNLKKPIK
jgi:hypothetical protein